MPDIQYKRGDFRLFRAITKIHLGAIEDDLQEDEVIEYDGTTMRRGPDVHQIATLRAAIKVGWLVPDEEESAVYVAQPAGVEIRPAESRGRERGPARKMGVVSDEERDLGSLNTVRGAKAPASHLANHAGTEVSHGAPTGAIVVDDNIKPMKVITDGGQEGRVIGRFKTSAQAAPVDLGKGEDRAIKSKLLRDDGTGVQIQKARAGETLDELLPDAASSGRPEGGISGEGDTQESADERAARLAQAKIASEARKAERMGASKKSEAAIRGVAATVSGGRASIEIGDKAQVSGTNQRGIDASVTVTPGMTSVGGAEDGEVVGKIGQVHKGAGPQPVSVEDAGVGLSDKPDIDIAAAGDAEVVDDVPAEAIIKAKIEMIQQFVPGFEWNMGLHWRKRVKAALTYRGNMPTLNAILSLETDAVKKHVMKSLYG